MTAWLTRCTSLAKPGVGTVHLHRRAWRPNRLREMWFQPESRSVMHPVPESGWEQVLAAETLEQAMAVVRHGQGVAPY